MFVSLEQIDAWQLMLEGYFTVSDGHGKLKNLLKSAALEKANRSPLTTAVL
jgi:hypothetical protein